MGLKKARKAESDLKQERARNAELTAHQQHSEEFLDKVLIKARDNQLELERETEERKSFEARVASLKEACFYQTLHFRKEKLLTKFLPASSSIREKSKSGAQ